MKPPGLCLSLLLLLFPASSSAADAIKTETDPPITAPELSKPLAEADRLYQTRDLDGHAERAIALYERSLQKNPDDAEALWKLARSFQWKGDRAANRADKTRAYERAVHYAQAAIAAHPEGIGGHLMLGIAYGRLGELQGVVKAFFLITKIKSELEIVLEKDPQNDVAHHVLGVLYRKLPRVFGGSIEKSIASLKAAIRQNPFRTRHYLELSQSYLDRGKKQEAVESLENLLSITQPEDPVQSLYDRNLAKTLLADLHSN